MILIAGSGPLDRNENVAGHNVFLVLSNYLTNRGYAVLRYDKRGVGDSSGSYELATMDHFANDAVAAMRWLKTQSNIDAASIGLLGHSSGGYVAPLAAQRAGCSVSRSAGCPGKGTHRGNGLPADRNTPKQWERARHGLPGTWRPFGN